MAPRKTTATAHQKPTSRRIQLGTPKVLDAAKNAAEGSEVDVTDKPFSEIPEPYTSIVSEYLRQSEAIFGPTNKVSITEEPEVTEPVTYNEEDFGSCINQEAPVWKTLAARTCSHAISVGTRTAIVGAIDFVSAEHDCFVNDGCAAKDLSSIMFALEALSESKNLNANAIMTVSSMLAGLTNPHECAMALANMVSAMHTDNLMSNLDNLRDDFNEVADFVANSFDLMMVPGKLRGRVPLLFKKILDEDDRNDMVTAVRNAIFI